MSSLNPFDRLADKVIAKLTPLLKELVKEAVDEANTDLKKDVENIPATILALLKKLPIIGPMLEGVTWPSI